MSNQNLVWHPSLITREQREVMNGHKAMVVWFTGLPGSGKSTTAHAAEQQLVNAGCQAYVLDGDNVRHGLSSDLGFSPVDRREHMRRVGELAKLMYTTGIIVLCAFISPTLESRRKVRELLPPGAFIEIYCQCPIEVCEQRDQKGFYAQARTGKIPDYTGVSAPYEEPLDPELVLETAALSPEQCAERVLALLRQRNAIPRVTGDSTTTQKDERT